LSSWVTISFSKRSLLHGAAIHVSCPVYVTYFM
jgi:hypothetical protein